MKRFVDDTFLSDPLALASIGVKTVKIDEDTTVKLEIWQQSFSCYNGRRVILA